MNSNNNSPLASPKQPGSMLQQPEVLKVYLSRFEAGTFLVEKKNITLNVVLVFAY